MVKQLRNTLALLLLFALPALAQGTGGGTQVFQNWYPTGDSPSVSIGNTSSANLYPSVGPTARICNKGLVDAFINPFGTSNSVVATTNSFWLGAGTCQSYNLKPFTTQYTYFAAITASGSTTLYVETGQGAPGSASNGSGSGGTAGLVTVVSVTATGTTTLASASQDVVVNTSAASPVVLNLPPVAGFPNCPSFSAACPSISVKDKYGDASTGQIEVTTTDSSTIDGSSAFFLPFSQQANTFVDIGSSWIVK